MSDPITPDERAAMRETIATLDAAWEADDPTRPLVTEHATLALLAHVASAVPRLLDALDTAEAEAARLLAEHTASSRCQNAACASCTHAYIADLERRVQAAEAARPAPVWDWDTVTEAARRAVAGVVVNASNWPNGAQAGMLGRDLSAPIDAITAAVIAVVREHAPVRPDRETIARALRDAGLVEVVAVHEGYGAEEVIHSHLRPVVDAVLAAWPGESRATVQAEALRDAGRWLVRIGYVGDFTFDTPAPDALWEAFVDAAHEDADGTMHGNTLTHTEVDDWLSEEARRPARTRADRLEKGADRG